MPLVRCVVGAYGREKWLDDNGTDRIGLRANGLFRQIITVVAPRNLLLADSSREFLVVRRAIGQSDAKSLNNRTIIFEPLQLIDFDGDPRKRSDRIVISPVIHSISMGELDQGPENTPEPLRGRRNHRTIQESRLADR